MSIVCESGHENLDGTLFCDICGQLMSGDSAAHQTVPVCPRCGLPNQPGATRCAHCDIPLLVGQPYATTAIPVIAALATTPATYPRLIVLADDTMFDLSGKEEIIIGRADPTCDAYPDIDLTAHGGDDGGVSRVHARVRCENGRYTIEDQKSINRTYVNKQRLDPYTPTPLKSGDELRLGRVVLRFEIGHIEG